jgi:hypothetical protein
MRYLVTLLALSCSMALLAPAPSRAEDASPVASPTTGPSVLPPDVPAYRLTYGEWAARHWQWLLSLPMAINPNIDATGEHCGYGQAGPVFFLTQTSAGTAERVCTVPAGTALFFPVLDTDCSTVEAPPFFGRDETELQTCVEALLATRAELTATVDGVAIPDLERYRAQSPLFTVALPADNWLEVEPAVAAAVADGYWLLLAPLPPGEHELHFGGALPDLGVMGEVTYHLTVAEPTVGEPPGGTPVP